MEKQLFELVPISERPLIFGSYIGMTKDNREIYEYFFDMEGWHFDEGEDCPEVWFRPVPNKPGGIYSFIQYHPDIVVPDGIYNGKYNSEPVIIRIQGGRPMYVSFIGFLNADGESQSSAIYNERGIIANSVEILLKGQVLSEGCFMDL